MSNQIQSSRYAPMWDSDRSATHQLPVARRGWYAVRRGSYAARLAIPALFLLAACDQTTAPNLGSNEVNETALGEAPIAGEIAASVDPDLSAALVADVTVAVSGIEGTTTDLTEAKAAFANASVSYDSGNIEAARELAFQGRSHLARAWIARKGTRGVDELFARIRNLHAESEDDDLVNGPRVRAAVALLLDRADGARKKGRSDRAVSDLLLAGQLVDHGQLENDRDHDGHAGKARFAVARAHAAVSLAERTLSDGATDSQRRLLQRAAELARAATAALDEGAYRRAFALGRRAESTALMAVLDSDGPSEEEIRLVHDLAETLLREAQAIAEPTVVQERLIAMANKQLELGERKLEAGLARGVGLLWRSAVTSSLALAG